ncbi:MAG: hypothetical protein JSU03_04590 [Bacteroidetes bacterium]|nr:hypothetical protein [Bacteroidota bacterium]MBS1756533.1 hypothetical protein [Bacteroidota bacterium]
MLILQTFYKKIRWPLCCLIFLFSCRQAKDNTDIASFKEDTLAKKAFVQRAFIDINKAEKFVQNGDIITRTGNDFTSQSLKALNQRDKTFSHCGIASIENDSVFVYHALGGDWNPNQKIRRDPFISFAEPYSNNEIGIFRFDIDTSLINNILNTAKHYYRSGITFDMDFDLATDNKMYCAEYVYKSLKNGSKGKLQFPLSHIGTFEFIGVDDIILHPLCKKKLHVVYK